MKCAGITRKNSLLPPFKANTCIGKVKKGKDGMYISLNYGVLWTWKKLRSTRHMPKT